MCLFSILCWELWIQASFNWSPLIAFTDIEEIQQLDLYYIPLSLCLFNLLAMIYDNSLALTDVSDQVLLHALVEHSFWQWWTSCSVFLFLWFFSGLHAINLFYVVRNTYKTYFWCAVWALYQYVQLHNEMCKSIGFQTMFLEEIGRTWFRNFQLSRNVLILSASDKQTYFTLYWRWCQELT